VCRSDIALAVDTLHTGGVIAYPTEAVYGLGCDPHNEAALQRLIDIKGRDARKGFILIASNQDQLTPFLAPVEPAWQIQFDKVWPGPVTFVVPAAPGISDLLSGFRKTLAVRVSDHPVVRRLCDRFGAAIVSTSANRSGQMPCRTDSAVNDVLGSSVDVIVRAAVGTLTSPTRIVDVRTGKELRAG
jgi:L-threonylcarbamoyladenylate synthase